MILLPLRRGHVLKFSRVGGGWVLIVPGSQNPNLRRRSAALAFIDPANIMDLVQLFRGGPVEPRTTSSDALVA